VYGGGKELVLGPKTAPLLPELKLSWTGYTIYARGIKEIYKLVWALNLSYIKQPNLPSQAKLNSEEPSALQAVASQATQKAPSQQASQATGAWLGLACLLTSLVRWTWRRTRSAAC